MSRKLTQLKRHPVPDWQRTRLQRWLDEWRVERALLGPADSGTDRPESGNADGLIAWNQEAEPFDTKDIRILWPVLVPKADRPVYVAVLRALSDSAYLVAPYGRFSEPANEGELFTQREDVPLRVLCLWNTLALSYESLVQSWKVDEISDAELEQAINVRKFVKQDQPLPPGLRERVGPPVYHHADPRIIYMREEIRLFRDLATGVVYPASGYDGLPKAADSGGPPYGSGPDGDPDGDTT